MKYRAPHVGDRAQIIDESHELNGKCGVIHRLCRSDDGIWLTMDDPLPDRLRSFPLDDDRGRNLLIYPEQIIILP